MESCWKAACVRADSLNVRADILLQAETGYERAKRGQPRDVGSVRDVFPASSTREAHSEVTREP
jgi:hypothetical protein